MVDLRQNIRPALSPTLRAGLQRLIEERVGLRLSTQQAEGLDATVAAVLASARDTLSPDLLYVQFSRGERSDLFDDLAARLTIGETHFFRVAPQIAALREVVLPDLLARRVGQRRLDVWSAGCSSGEEPYTLAILLRELRPDIGEWDLRLVATDLSEDALAEARRASYRAWSFRETPESIRQRYFDHQGDTWHLHGAIRRMVKFGRLNLVADPFPLPGWGSDGLDLILCRNVTIYFNPPVVRRLYSRFSAALAPGGWLIVGPSDPVPPEDLFDAVYLPNAVIWRKRMAELPPARNTNQPRPITQASKPHKVSTGDIGEASRARRAPVAAIPPQSPRPVPVASATKADERRAVQLAEVRALAQAGEPQTAQARLQALVRDEPLAADAHRLLGILALADGRSADALESLRRATFLAADDPLAQFALGRTYRALGDPRRARGAFRHARRILAAWPGDQPVPGDDGLTADELRRLLDAQLGSIGDVPGGGM